MSLVARPLPSTRAARPIDGTNTRAFYDKPDVSVASRAASFDEPIFDRFCDMDAQDTMAPSPKRVRSHGEIPALPPKSALRSSRLLDNHGLKLGGAVAAGVGLDEVNTPHDLYLSSEEDASTDADDFSDYDDDDDDYDYDASVEDPASPTGRSSHEVTARVVAVVFSGKPLMVDLPPARRRAASSSSLGTGRRTRSSTDSAAPAKAPSPPPPPTTTMKARATTFDFSPTPANSVSSRHSRYRPAAVQERPAKDAATNRRSIILSELLTKKKPPFLSIDPYANGARDLPKALDSLEGEVHSAKTPRTPTALIKGVTRSFSLLRKRSRPNFDTGPAVSSRLGDRI